MHIPDGYLSPETTIPALIGMVPVWAVAAKKVKEKVGEKNLPTLALGAAFSFTIMMMNVPVAGGSSAHAVGAVLIAILLGPWAATIAVSSALFIQALVFGDGGILAFGINCLNMAVIMPFTGYYIYRLISGKDAEPGSSKSIIGAVIGGYIGINIAAFCASVEFGIQPLLFTGADGAALYCPYPLSVSIPSMMFAHLLAAGPIEAIITGAAVAYISKSAPNLFLRNQHTLAVAGDAIGSTSTNLTSTEKQSFFKRYKALLIPIGVLVLFTPLGLIATGTAWGEWGTDEIKGALGYVPKGFSAMADWWKSLMPDYSVPAFGSGTAGSIAGYVLSAIVGILLIGTLIFILSLFIRKSKKGNATGEQNQ